MPAWVLLTAPKLAFGGCCSHTRLISMLLSSALISGERQDAGVLVTRLISGERQGAGVLVTRKLEQVLIDHLRCHTYALYIGWTFTICIETIGKSLDSMMQWDSSESGPRSQAT